MRSISGASLGLRLCAFAFLALALTSFLAQALSLPPDTQELDTDNDLPAENVSLDLSTNGPTTIIDDDGSTIGTVSLPPVIAVPLEAFQGSTVPKNIVDDIKKSLPQILREEGFTESEIASLSDAELAEILSGLNDFFEDGEGGHEHSLDNPEKRDELDERGILDSIGDAIKRRACRVFARITRPAFMAAAGLFNVKNLGSGSGIYHYQKFFLYALHKRLFDNNINVRVYYKANWVVKKFWGSAGVSFGKKVYIRKPYQAFPGTNVNNFYNQVFLLAHELQHTQQYYSKSWSLWNFGFDYLYNYCRAGFSYSKNKMEREARDAANKVATLLSSGRGFFNYWRVKSLYVKLGYPVETSYRGVSASVWELNFQKGKMQIDHSKNPDCYRYRVGSGAWTAWECRSL